MPISIGRSPTASHTSRFAAVAFDLDGVLFDTEALFFRVTSAILADRGKVFTAEMMSAMIGRQAHLAYPALKALAELEETPDELLALARTRFYAEIDTAVHPTPGLFALLDHLGQRGLPLTVATSSRRNYAEHLLRRHGMWERFTFVLCAEDVTRSKPDPEIYQLAASRFRIPPQSLLVIEDSPSGVAAATGAGAFTIAVPHEHSPAAGLAAAELIVPRLDDPALLALL